MGACTSRGSADDKPAVDPRDDWADGVPVYVNVYDLQARPQAPSPGASSSSTKASPTTAGSGSINSAMGFGFYHSGVQIYDMEFSFGGDGTGQAPAGTPGIFVVPPKGALPAVQFYKQHLLGHLPKGTSAQAVVDIASGMQEQWEVHSYNICAKNCNHFTQAFLDKLSEVFDLTGRRALELPAYVNRAARFGSALAPKAVLRALSRSAPKATDGSAAPPSASGSRFGGGGGGTSHPPRADESKEEERRRAAEAKKQHPLPTTREELSKMTVRELKTAMFVHGVDWSGCVEKGEMVDVVLAHHKRCQPR